MNENATRLRALSDVGIGRYLDSFDEVRLNNLYHREKPLLDLNNDEDLSKVLELYKLWLQHDEYGVFKLESADQTRYMTVKLAKRGNDVYAYRVKRGLKDIEGKLRSYIQECSSGETNTLYVTLTCDPKIYLNDREIAWRQIGKDWNRFLSALRKEYGKILEYRSWEAFENGYPHIHAVLVFRQRTFTTIQHKNTWRILKYRKDQIAKHWHSFVDVIAVTADNLEHTIHDVAQYVAKFCNGHDYREFDRWPSKRKKTLAILWYLRKRCFAISRELRVAIEDEGQAELPLDLTCGECVTQTKSVEFLGLVSRSRANLDPHKWVEVFSDRPSWVDGIWKPRNCKLKRATKQWCLEGEPASEVGRMDIRRSRVPEIYDHPMTRRERIMYTGDPFRGLTDDELRTLNSVEAYYPG